MGNRAVEIRGGGALGPIDEELVNKLSTLVTTAYVASAGQKYISGATGVASAGLADTFSSEFMGIVAFCTAVSNGLFGLLDSGYGQTELTFYLTTLTMLGKIMDPVAWTKPLTLLKPTWNSPY